MNNFKKLSELVDAVEKIGVFDIIIDGKDCELIFDESGYLDSNFVRTPILVSLKKDVVLSKIKFKELCEIMPKKNGYVIKQNANLNSNVLLRLLDFSIGATKRSNQYHKEVLENRLNGVYKQKHEDGMQWNSGGHK